MKIELDLKKLEKEQLSVDQYLLLCLLYYQRFDYLVSLFSRQCAYDTRDTLVGTKYLLSDSSVTVKNTVLSKNNVEKLLDIKSDTINFWEFYSKYPIKVGTRVLRAGSYDTVIGKKHEKKYLDKIKKVEQHLQAVRAIEVYVAKQKQSGKLEYLPNIETVLNNAMWESWKELEDVDGEENSNWNINNID